MKFKSASEKKGSYVVLSAEQNAVNGMLLVRKCDIKKMSLQTVNCR